ncbi:MAG: hypothetical protein IPN75_07845 [Dechloromonas sp.]|uniref:Uncharacterized protein n=1 Tax=Candidatus Dechloromonas phosphorivorans TaxID=2899244 RepID=A0A9D7LQK8_9RHOO|nr:hypothetical protein [Candidatus Dechloromonas phosphorivorans]
MPDLSTTYLGLALRSPAGAVIDAACHNIDAVLHLKMPARRPSSCIPLFEEDVRNDELMIDRFLIHPTLPARLPVICRSRATTRASSIATWSRSSYSSPAWASCGGQPQRRLAERLGRIGQGDAGSRG